MLTPPSAAQAAAPPCTRRAASWGTVVTRAQDDISVGLSRGGAMPRPKVPPTIALEWHDFRPLDSCCRWLFDFGDERVHDLIDHAGVRSGDDITIDHPRSCPWKINVQASWRPAARHLGCARQRLYPERLAATRSPPRFCTVLGHDCERHAATACLVPEMSATTRTPSLKSRSRKVATWARAQDVRAARSRSSCISTYAAAVSRTRSWSAQNREQLVRPIARS